MEELEALLAAGRSLDELQRVAKGEPPYANFKLQVSSPGWGRREPGTRLLPADCCGGASHLAP